MERKREGQKRGIEKETEGKGERERVERAREGRRRAGEQQFIVSHFINLTFFPCSLFFFFTDITGPEKRGSRGDGEHQSVVPLHP